jgi:hypothetical protein
MLAEPRAVFHIPIGNPAVAAQLQNPALDNVVAGISLRHRHSEARVGQPVVHMANRLRVIGLEDGHDLVVDRS